MFIKAYAPPKLFIKEQHAFQKNIALNFYVSGTLFQSIENFHLKEVMKTLRSDGGLLPNGKQLATSLLNNCKLELMVSVKERVHGTTVCFETNRWTHIKNDAVVNYMAVPPVCSLYLEAVQTGQQSRGHEFIARDVQRGFETYKDTAFAGTVMDNTNANKKSRAPLRENFPSRFFQSCTSHGLHIFVKDIFCETKKRKLGSDTAMYLVDYSFEYMLAVIVKCKDVVKFFHSHHVVKLDFHDKKKIAGV